MVPILWWIKLEPNRGRYIKILRIQFQIIRHSDIFLEHCLYFGLFCFASSNQRSFPFLCFLRIQRYDEGTIELLVIRMCIILFITYPVDIFFISHSSDVTMDLTQYYWNDISIYTTKTGCIVKIRLKYVIKRISNSF